MKKSRLLYMMALLLPVMAQAQIVDPNDIITHAPEGQKKLFTVKSGYYSRVAGPYTDEVGQAAEMVFCDNGDVYIKNPVVHFATNSYIKGHLDGNKITVEFPQLIRYITNYPGFAVRFKYEVNDEGTTCYYYKDLDNQTITYEIREDGSIVMEDSTNPDNPNAPAFILGMTGGMSAWSGYGDFDVVYTPVGESVVVPAGVEIEDSWVMKSDNQPARFVKVAVDGDDFYLGNLYKGLENRFIKGKIADGKVVFENGQLLDMDSATGYLVYVVGGHTEKEWNDQFSLWIDRMKMDENLTFTYDAEAKALKSEQSIVMNTAPDRIYFLMDYAAPSINWQDPEQPYVAPAAPTLSEASQFNGDSGYLRFKMPELDENGLLMPVENLYFNFYVNGHPFTFYQDEYPRLPEDEMLNIPYSFNDNLSIMGAQTEHTVYFYCYGADSVGVRSILILEDGTELASGIVTHEFNSQQSAVGDIFAGREPVKTIYYDLSGRQVANPDRGIYLKVETFDDGATRTSKVALK